MEAIFAYRGKFTIYGQIGNTQIYTMINRCSRARNSPSRSSLVLLAFLGWLELHAWLDWLDIHVDLDWTDRTLGVDRVLFGPLLPVEEINSFEKKIILRDVRRGGFCWLILDDLC